MKLLKNFTKKYSGITVPLYILVVISNKLHLFTFAKVDNASWGY